MLNKTIMLNDSFIPINDDEELIDDSESSIDTPIYSVENRENNYTTLVVVYGKCCLPVLCYH